MLCRISLLKASCHAACTADIWKTCLSMRPVRVLIVSSRLGVKLLGFDFVYAASWPRAIHEGGGTMRVYIDERGLAEQRAAPGSPASRGFSAEFWPLR